MTLGENIRRKRLEIDIEQQELAKRVGLTNAMICLIEKNKRMPSVGILNRIANVLRCSIDELLERKVS